MSCLSTILEDFSPQPLILSYWCKEDLLSSGQCRGVGKLLHGNLSVGVDKVGVVTPALAENNIKDRGLGLHILGGQWHDGVLYPSPIKYKKVLNFER